MPEKRREWISYLFTKHVTSFGGLATDLQDFAMEMRNDMKQVRHQLSKALEKLDELLEHMAELKACLFKKLQFRSLLPDLHEAKTPRMSKSVCHSTHAAWHAFFTQNKENGSLVIQKKGQVVFSQRTKQSQPRDSTALRLHCRMRCGSLKFALRLLCRMRFGSLKISPS